MLHRMRGVKIGRNVFIGDDVYLENEYPEAVEIQDGAVISLQSTLIAHAGNPAKQIGLIAGRIVIGRDVFIGACTVIIANPGSELRIGDGAVIGACSAQVGRSVAPYAFIQPAPSEQVGTAKVALPVAKTYMEFVTGLRPHKRVLGRFI